jgi:hypothetical protein
MDSPMGVTRVCVEILKLTQDSVRLLPSLPVGVLGNANQNTRLDHLSPRSYSTFLAVQYFRVI